MNPVIQNLKRKRNINQKGALDKFLKNNITTKSKDVGECSLDAQVTNLVEVELSMI